MNSCPKVLPKHSCFSIVSGKRECDCMKHFFLILMLAGCLSCLKNRNAAVSASPEDPQKGVKAEGTSTGDADSTYITNWDLTALFNSEGTESTAYLKRISSAQGIFPSAWDRFDNTSGDPTEGEAYIPIPNGEIATAFADVLDLSISKKPVIAARVLWTDGTQNLYVYRIDDRYQPSEIFSLASKGQININHGDRDDVQIQNDEPLAEGIRRTQYRYEGGKFTSISPVILDKKQVPGYRDNAEGKSDQISRLRGPWVFRENLPDSIFTPAGMSRDRVIVSFMPETRQIIFSQNDMAEIFSWRSSTNVLSGLLISLQNSFVSQIVQSAIIQFLTPDRIIIRFQGDMIWTGIYDRMTRQQRNFTIEQQNMILHPNGMELAGSYRSADGREFFFSYPNFTMRQTGDNPSEEHGTYAILHVNKQDILEIHTTDQNGWMKQRHIYQFSNSERKEGGRLIRSFVITPGDLYIYGVVTDGARPTTFEQVSINAEK